MNSIFKYNLHNFFFLPSVWWCGIRVKTVDEKSCIVRVRHKWINQNPFKSMFWAVQGMAAELCTGVLIMNEIKLSKKKFSMLVLNNQANFSKKATGIIFFECNQGTDIRKSIEKVVETNESQTIWLTSVGKNSQNQIVSTFKFEWTLKLKN